MINGVLSSAINPMAFSLVSDFFPADKRTTANSVLSVANYIGIGLSSLSIILIKNVGWRSAYTAMGALGLLGATLLVPFKNPTRTESKEDKSKSSDSTADS